MANLDNYSDIFANLAQGAYAGRPDSKSFADKSGNQKDQLKKNGYAKYDFGDGTKPVYLQPDNSVKTVEEKKLLWTKTYQKGLLTDEKAGFNAYYVTDTPTLTKETKNTYFITRGSDAASLKTINDWVENNADFALNDVHTPQAKLATEAMQQKINEMSTKAPNAKMSVTGHSLGTMVSIQGVANLSAGDIEKIDKVVLFQGPDARESIQKMSPQAQKNIKKLEDEGRIEYYVNAFDVVSMLNRNKKGVDEIGKVHYLLPKTITTTFDTSAESGSSHDFGQYQLNPDGTLKVANLKDHPAIFAAGTKLSKLIDDTLDEVGKIAASAGVTNALLLSAILTGGISGIMALFSGKITYDQAKALYDKFNNGYSDIIEDAKLESEWDKKVKSLQKSISSSSGSKKIKLQEELARAVATKAKKTGEQYQIIVQTELEEEEDEISEMVKEVIDGARDIQRVLSSFDVESIIAPFKKENLWDSGVADENRNQTKKYAEKLSAFSEKLNKAADNITKYDGGAGKEMFEN